MTGTASIGGSAIGLTAISGGYLYLTQAGRSLDSNWSIRTTTGTMSDLLWTQRSLAYSDLQVPWTVQGSIVAATTLLQWADRALSSDSVDLPWDIKRSLDSDLLIPWGLRTSSAKDVAATWRQFQALSGESILDWQVRLVETKDLAAPWSQRKKEGIELSVYWDIVGAVVASTASLLWSSRSLEGSNVNLDYAIRATLRDSLVGRWGVLKRSSSEQATYWNVRSIRGNSVIVDWRVEGPRGREFIGTQVISLSKLTADVRIAVIDPLITVFVVDD